MVDESEKNAMMFIKEVHELLKIFFERKKFFLEILNSIGLSIINGCWVLDWSWRWLMITA